MSFNTELIIFVYTGNRKNSGTDSTVYMKIHGNNGTTSKTIVLNNLFSNDFEGESISTFRVKEIEILDRFVKVERLEVWKNKTLGLFSDNWYVDKIVVENCATNATFVFPFFRWIKPGIHYNIKHLDTCLPQFEEFPQQRKNELEEKKEKYEFEQKYPNASVQVKTLPPDEQFVFAYKWELFRVLKLEDMKQKFLSWLPKNKWTCLDDIDQLYAGGTYPKPKNADKWNCDLEFGRQRIANIHPTMIFLMKTIPEKFPVTDEMMKPLLEGLTILEAITLKRLFLCDLKLIEGVDIRPGFEICIPIAMFFVDKEKDLRPVAIQLFQEPGPDNPIFTPLDDPMLWTFVKMWYNNADSNIYQAFTHLGSSHLLMEGAALATQRNISPSHPIYKLLAPHNLYLFAINDSAFRKIASDGTLADTITNVGGKGFRQMAAKAVDEHRMNVEGLVPEELKARGLDDPNVLPGFHYRDDALLIFGAIKKYVTSYVDLYYTCQELLKEDGEIQAWAKELVRERNGSNGGIGMKGVPGNGSIDCSEDLVAILTAIIYRCSAFHAAVNFGQYEQMAYPPMYPMLLRGKPPKSKCEKITERTLMDSLPDKRVSGYIAATMLVLDNMATNSLGDFEVQYIFDPRAKKIVNELRKDLENVSKIIKARNEVRNHTYDQLLPELIPNSISI